MHGHNFVYFEMILADNPRSLSEEEKKANKFKKHRVKIESKEDMENHLKDIL